MARKPGKVRTQRVIVLYSNEEFEKLRKMYARSTSRSFSSYVRKVSLEEPVEMIMRNGSFDSFVDEIVVLRREMKVISDRTSLPPELQDRLVQLHEEIRLYIHKIADLCMPH